MFLNPNFQLTNIQLPENEHDLILMYIFKHQLLNSNRQDELNAAQILLNLSNGSLLKNQQINNEQKTRLIWLENKGCRGMLVISSLNLSGGKDCSIIFVLCFKSLWILMCIHSFISGNELVFRFY